jgi:RimJ/RimL family protein N-acetyltransferase
MTQDLSTVAWPVRTERLTLRPATAADVDATWAYRRLPEVGEWLTQAPSDRDEFAAGFLQPEWLASTLVVELDGTVIGDLMLRIGEPWAQAEVADQAKGTQAELGWVLAPSYVGRGYATEAVTALLRVCFDDLGLRRVTAACFADNEASWRLMERVGMRKEEHTRRDSLHRTRGWLDGMGWGLLAEDWRARAR